MKINPTSDFFFLRKNIFLNLMRTFIFLCCFSAFSFSSDKVFSQNAKINISTDKVVTVDQVFDLIMEQTDYKFIYQDGLFKDLPKIQLKKGIINANKLLQQSLSVSSFDFEVSKNNTIIIKRTQAKAQIQANKVLEPIVINGVVKDDEGFPLPGVKVQVKGTDIITYTDFNGSYAIAVSSQQRVLVFTYLALDI